MPHIKLEYSTNIRETIHTQELFSSCHQIIVKRLNADITRCQSRAQSFDQFYVGQGSSHEAFIYLEIKILEGRTTNQLNELKNELSEFLRNYFAQSIQELKLRLSLRIVEFSPSHYQIIEATK